MSTETPGVSYFDPMTVTAQEKARDYEKEYREYHSKPEQKKNRAKRNAGRRKLGLKKGDGKEVDHKKPLSKGGGNGDGNLRSVKRATNRKKGDSAESMSRSVAELVVEAALIAVGGPRLSKQMKTLLKAMQANKGWAVKYVDRKRSSVSVGDSGPAFSSTTLDALIKLGLAKRESGSSFKDVGRKGRERWHSETHYQLTDEGREAVKASFTVLGLRPQPKPSPGEWRKIYDDAKPVKNWRCCTKPVKKQDRNGDTYWGATCSYKRGNEQGSVWRKVSEGDQRPTEIRIGGKKIRSC